MKYVTIFVFLVLFFGSSVAEAMEYTAEYRDYIFSLVEPTITTAVVTESVKLKSSPSPVAKSEGELLAGETVEVLMDSGKKWYKVRNYDAEAEGWLEAKSIQIVAADDGAKKALMTAAEIEAFADIMAFKTKSGYLLWTDISRQRTHILKKETGGFRHIKTFICSTGADDSPTTRGFFTVSDRGEWFYSKRFQSGAKYWVRFNGTYLYHSVAMNRKKEVIDNTLGRRCSSGCVRLAIDDAKWIYDNIPRSSSVFVH